MDNKLNEIVKTDIYDYLVFCEKNHIVCKLTGVVTNKQIVFKEAKTSLYDLPSMIKELNQLVFVNHVGTHSYKDSIELYLDGYNLKINLPKRISVQQYQVIHEMINQIKKFERDFKKKVDFDADKILKEAEEKISDFYYIEASEKIVGEPINEEILILSMKRNLNISNIKNITDLKIFLEKVFRYYNDEFFKSIIIKIIPNVQKVSQIYDKLFMYNNLDKMVFDIDNLSYSNIMSYLEGLLEKNVNKNLKENSYNSLEENEIKARREWMNNKSSYELYKKYKDAIYSRIDYENNKELVENYNKKTNMIKNSKSKEEIDLDLDYFENEERKLLDSKHFTNEEKKKMIEDLYSEFDEYAEKNPETKGRHFR